MNICPVCRNTNLNKQTYYDEQGIVENYEGCDKCNNYKEHWSYGYTSLKIGKYEFDFTDHYYMDDNKKIIAKKYWLQFYKIKKIYMKRNKII